MRWCSNKLLVTVLCSALGLSEFCRADEPVSTDAAGEAAWNAERFDREIAPLLARRCLDCHNSNEHNGSFDLTHRGTAFAGGDSGAAIEPGKPAESLLWQRVEADEMPPEHPLPAEEKVLLREWIAAGSLWGADPIDRFRFTSEHRAGYDWWSLQPVERPPAPTVQRSDWARGAIDQFVLARLEAAQLAPSREATAAVLARRLYFDLTGLPPTPEELQEFLTDTRPDAYERLVDRLLASPAYGERWARHWLDVARFGESHGFEYDEPRRNAWPYRDWVIAAFNNDLPFDEFARLQIAGDVIAPDHADSITATGFLVAGPYDTPGQNQQSAAMKAVVRQDEIEDLVGTVSQTFLGLTVNCARCHDHKFDPIAQREYYGIAAALSGVRHGERELPPRGDAVERARQLADAHGQVTRLRSEIEAIDAPVRQAILAEGGESGAQAPQPIARWQFDTGLADSVGGRDAELQGRAKLEEGTLVLDDRKSFATTLPLDRDLVEKTLHVRVALDDIEQRGGAAMSLQTLDGAQFDAIVFGEAEPGRWMAGSDHFKRTKSFAAPEETEAGNQPVDVTITYAADGTITCYRNGQPYGQPYLSEGPQRFAAGTAQVVFGLRHSPADRSKLLAGAIHRAELFDRALSAEEVAACCHHVSVDAIVARLDGATAQRRTTLAAELRAQEGLLRTDETQKAYVCVAKQAEPTHLLKRGDTRLAGDLVSACGIRAAGGDSADFGLAPDAPQAEGRLALARWITSPENPLFARVVVNRLWHYHFGAGLVETPNDFGFNAGRPSHPELLDWLASELVERGYRLKELQRLIVTSATYRQTSLPRPEALAVDRGNRLMWRYAPQRLEAESVRDAVLAVAGRLNSERGGPGFRDFREINRAGTWSYLPSDPVGAEFERRSIYRMWPRGGRGGLLDVFDCPDPSVTSPRRAVTTTPLQALALLNHSFLLRMCDATAERLAREAGDDRAAQVERAFLLAYGRAPNDAERAGAATLIGQHGLAALVRAILNSNEFLYID